MHSTDRLDDGYLGSGKVLRYSLKKYGKENHVREIVEDCSEQGREFLREREKIWVDQNRLQQKQCMNLILGGGFDDETCSKISASLKKNKKPSPMLGRKMSDETKARLSASKKGKPKSIEHKLKLSESLKGSVPWMKGKNHSDESKEKMSVSHQGKGCPVDPLTREKISNTLKGRKRTEQEREAMKEGWARRRAMNLLDSKGRRR